MRVEFKARPVPTDRTDLPAGLLEYIAVHVDSGNIVERPATDDDRQRWKAEYDAFMEGNEALFDLKMFRGAFAKLEAQRDELASRLTEQGEQAQREIVEARSRATDAERRVAELEGLLANVTTPSANSIPVVSAPVSDSDPAAVMTEPDEAPKRKSGKKG